MSSSSAAKPVFLWPEYDSDLCEILRLCTVLSFAYAWGRGMHALLRAPPYIGELIGGFILGPSLLNVVPYTSALRLVGIMGILMISFEAGLRARFHTFRFAYIIALLAAVCCTSAAIFLGALALNLGPSHHGFQEGVAGGTAVCAASTSSAVFMEYPSRNNPVPNFVSSVAVLEGALCLTVFTIIQGLQPGWGWADVTQPAIASVVLIVLSFVLRRAMPSLLPTQYLPIDRGWLIWLFGFDSWLVLVMAAGALGACALAESIRTTMVLGALLAGAVFAKVGGAADAWTNATWRVRRLLGCVFFASSVGFVIPRDEWNKPDSVLGGLVLLAFTIIAKSLVSLIVAGLFWPQASLALASQVCIAMAVPAEVNFYIVILFQRGNLLSARGTASVLWCLIFLTAFAPLLLIFILRFFARPDPGPLALEAEEAEDMSPVKQPPAQPHVHFEKRPGSVPPAINQEKQYLLAASNGKVANVTRASPHASEPATQMAVRVSPSRPEMMVQRPQPALPSSPPLPSVYTTGLPAGGLYSPDVALANGWRRDVHPYAADYDMDIFSSSPRPLPPRQR